MIVNERTDDDGTYLEIERNETLYRTESFGSLASLYTSMPLEISNLETGKRFAILELSNVGTYILNVI